MAEITNISIDRHLHPDNPHTEDTQAAQQAEKNCFCQGCTNTNCTCAGMKTAPDRMTCDGHSNCAQSGCTFALKHREEELISEEAETGAKANIVMLPIDVLHPHPDNPRKDVGDVTELADSIKANGVLQNLTVVPYFSPVHKRVMEGLYTVIIGHRRLAAAKKAGLNELPCVIVEMSEKEQLSTMLTENMQRVDLTVYEQAQGFQMMLDMGSTVEEIAEKSGFSKTTVRRRVKMMELDQKTLKEVSERQLSLSDFDKLAQVESIKTRNKILQDIGTFNFDNAVTRAIREEHRKKVMPDAKKQAAALGVKQIPDSDRYSVKYEQFKHIDLCSWKPEDGLGVKDTDGVFYSFDNWGNLYFYRKKKKAAPEKKSKAQIAREKAIADAHAAVKEESAIAFELRQKFVQSLSVTHKNSSLFLRGAAIGIVASTVLYKIVDRRALLKLLGVDPDGKWDEVRSDGVRAITSREDDNLTPAIVYASFQDSKSNGYHSAYKDEWPKHNENLMLDALYAWLTLMGYEMSDGEKALQDGTHELFQEQNEEDSKNA